jgi:hypothetical protein
LESKLPISSVNQPYFPRDNRRKVLESKLQISSVNQPYCAARSLTTIKTRTPPGSLDQPYCSACSLSTIKKRTPPGQVGGKPPPQMQIKAGDPQSGDCVSVDQYVTSVPGRLSNTIGKESSALKYHGGTIFVDQASSFSFLINQTSLRAGETLQAEIAFERLDQTCAIRSDLFE